MGYKYKKLNTKQYKTILYVEKIVSFSCKVFIVLYCLSLGCCVFFDISSRSCYVVLI